MKTKNLFLNLGFSLCLLFPLKNGWSNSLIERPAVYAVAKANRHSPLSKQPHPVSLPPTVTITSPAAGSTFTPGSAISIAANATDADGMVDSVEFFMDGISIGVDKNVPFETTYTVFGGNHTITAKATDNEGLYTTSNPVNITYSNQSPLVSITAPANNSTFTQGTIVTLNADASDPDGSVSYVAFYADGNLLKTVYNPPYQTDYTTTFGHHTITARATDNNGAVSISSINVEGTGPSGDGLENIIVEKYYVSNAADAAQADAEIDQYNAENGTSLPHGALPVGSVTYRFYADMKPGYKLLAVYADQSVNHSLVFTTTTSFYNNLLGGMIPNASKSAIHNKLLALDSYLTLGGVATGQFGILKTEDNGVANNISTASNPAGVLLNNDASIGIPLTTQDGMIAGSNVVIPSFAGFTGQNAEAFNDGTTISNSLNLPDGSVYSVNNPMGPDSSNKLLIAQVTTNGSLHYELNLLLQITSGTGEYYVARNPVSGEVSYPFLSGDLINSHVNLPPTVSITSPSNNSSLLDGNTILITADANDVDDTVSSVEFFVDGTSLGIDAIPPFSIIYTVTNGTHVLTAKAKDNYGLQTVSGPVSIKGVKSIPNVAITNPVDNSTYNLNTTIQITATASDAVGSIDSVEFFVDGISIGVDKAAPYSFPYIASGGTHQLISKATNNQGIEGSSLPVNIHVTDPNATIGLEKIYIEKYYVSNAADAIQADQESTSHGLPTGALPAGSVTYRFYADLLPEYKLFSLYADSVQQQPLKFKTSTTFYNHPSGSITPIPGTTKPMIKNDLLALDSYLSLGGVANGQYGIPKTDDDGTLNNVSTADNPAGVLLNNTPYMVYPLASRDGMISGAGVKQPSFFNIRPAEVAAFSDGNTLSNQLRIEDGSVFANFATGPVPGSNKILIAQVTTNGILDYELNLLLTKPDGTAEFYAAHPSADNNSTDHFIPGLLGTLNPNSQPYSITSSSNFCTEPSFCLPVVANENVKDVIGYDIVLSYDKTKVHPTGNITLSDQLIHQGYASYAINNNAAAGEVNISVFLSAAAPDNTTFNGMGELLCVEFTKDASLGGTETVPFTITSLQESYSNGVKTVATDAGSFTNKKNTLFPGALQFWTDHSPINNLHTNIYGTNSLCVHTSSPVHPELNGDFTYNVLNGSFIDIFRDVPNYKDVQVVINGFDASLGRKVLINDLSFVPSIYQMIALDVNTDGVISAGDISQLNQRSVKTIGEFKQSWNYNNNGTSNGQTSKDWLFVNDTLLAQPAYKISTTYPANDGSGYSKYKVPVVPFCLKLPNPVDTSCRIYQKAIYTGVLLGDINGNYDAIPADGEIKRIIDANYGSIYLNLDKAVSGLGYIDVPVSFTSSQNIVSLDFALQFSRKAIGFDKVVSNAAYLDDAMANFAKDDQTLRFTSNSHQQLKEGDAIAIIRFSTNTEQLSASDFTGMVGYLNGQPVSMIAKGNIATSISTSASAQTVNAYPNPVNNLLQVTSTEKGTVVLTDLQGRLVSESLTIAANEVQNISTGNIAEGTYLLKVYNEHFVSTQRIVIEHNP